MSQAAQSDFLLQMAESSRLRDARSRAIQSDAQQRSQLVCLNEPPALMLAEHGFDVIAEIKKRSPAEGDLSGQLASPVEQADAYVQGGAAVLSVLTEPDRFDGHLDDLHAVATHANPVPVMRKDFLVSRYQVREGRLAGAAGVLLIAAMLTEAQLEAMLQSALELGMFALIEVFGPDDLDQCMSVLERAGPAVVDGRCRFLLGVNCRDLRSLKVDFDHFAVMAPRLPADIPWVAESGLTDTAQAATLAKLGYRLALVGTTLMRSADPGAAVREIRATGAAACS